MIVYPFIIIVFFFSVGPLRIERNYTIGIGIGIGRATTIGDSPSSTSSPMPCIHSHSS
jgi:hypothetical protein